MHRQLFKAILDHPDARHLKEHEWEIAHIAESAESFKLLASMSDAGAPCYKLWQQSGSNPSITRELTLIETASALRRAKPWLTDIVKSVGIDSAISELESEGRIYLDSISFGSVTVSVIFERLEANGPESPREFYLLLKNPREGKKPQHYLLSGDELADGILQEEPLLVNALRHHPEVVDILLSQDAGIFSAHEANQLRELSTDSPTASSPKPRL